MTFKQVEYLVHWMHQLELVPNKQHIAVPSSKSLLFEEDLEEIVSPIAPRPSACVKAESSREGAR
jgi:hypothetical protein